MRTPSLVFAVCLTGACAKALQFRPDMAEELQGKDVIQKLASADKQIEVLRLNEPNTHRSWRSCDKNQLLLRYSPNAAGGMVGDSVERLSVLVYCGDDDLDKYFQANFHCDYNPLTLLIASDSSLSLKSGGAPKREDFVTHTLLIENAGEGGISYHLPRCFTEEE